MEGMKDWNKMDTDEYIKHLKNEFEFQSSGTAKCVFELIESHTQLKERVKELEKELYNKSYCICEHPTNAMNGTNNCIQCGKIIVQGLLNNEQNNSNTSALENK